MATQKGKAMGDTHEGHRFDVGHATVRILQDEIAENSCPVDIGKGMPGIGMMDPNVLFCDIGRRSGMRPAIAGDWGPMDLQEYARVNKFWEIPLYKYEHSGVVYRTGDIHAPSNPFTGHLPQGHAEFDSGRCGSILIAKSEFRLSKKAAKYAADICQEVTDWCNGNVWGYVIDLPDEDYADSCWGFIGEPDNEYIVGEATAAAKHLSESYAQRVAAQTEASDERAAREMEAERADMYGEG